ncbi:MAG: response regulator [Cytophagaceae bacterium]
MESVTHVLLVDDDLESNSQNERAFRRANFKKIKVTLNGGHALVYLHQIQDAIRDSKIVIILDVDMPIMDGKEFLKNYNLTKEFCKDNILIVVQGNELSSRVIEDMQKLGVEYFVNKPVKISQIQSMVNEYFSPAQEKAIVKKFPYNQDQRRAALG